MKKKKKISRDTKQLKVAEKAGVHYSTISNIENGKSDLSEKMAGKLKWAIIELRPQAAAFFGEQVAPPAPSDAQKAIEVSVARQMLEEMRLCFQRMEEIVNRAEEGERKTKTG